MLEQTERPARAGAYGAIPCTGRIREVETPAVAHFAAGLEHVRSAVTHAGQPQDDPSYIPDNVTLIRDQPDRVLEQAGVSQTPEPAAARWPLTTAVEVRLGRRPHARAGRTSASRTASGPSDHPRNNYTT
ncbi:hypothetical protein ACWDG9_17285 [Streptomyces sp. NPDC001073]